MDNALLETDFSLQTLETTDKLKGKILNLLLVLTSLMGYLEWGKGDRSFLIQAEAEIISKLFTDPTSVIHPFTILPLAGQLILLSTLIQMKPNKHLTLIGIAGIGILFVLIFVIGLLSLHYKIILSTLPFLAVAFLTIRYHRSK